MENWDAWESEIQERLAELSDERRSPESGRDRRWWRSILVWFGLGRGVTDP
jgi:hypothetical protein